ncbi:MAG TPA: hypothetical protein VGQ58_05895 [Candidatus Limnocylindrales bacterium]|nr:hypothetical protein [Candidatus Limnocylindrales bacterium]
MDPRYAAVDGRIDDIRRLSAELHIEREVSEARRSRRGGLRHALGLRFVALGATLLGELDGPAQAAARR